MILWPPMRALTSKGEILIVPVAPNTTESVSCAVHLLQVVGRWRETSEMLDPQGQQKAGQNVNGTEGR